MRSPSTTVSVSGSRNAFTPERASPGRSAVAASSAGSKHVTLASWAGREIREDGRCEIEIRASPNDKFAKVVTSSHVRPSGDPLRKAGNDSWMRTNSEMPSYFMTK